MPPWPQLLGLNWCKRLGGKNKDVMGEAGRSKGSDHEKESTEIVKNGVRAKESPVLRKETERDVLKENKDRHPK